MQQYSPGVVGRFPQNTEMDKAYKSIIFWKYSLVQMFNCQFRFKQANRGKEDNQIKILHIGRSTIKWVFKATGIQVLGCTIPRIAYHWLKILQWDACLACAHAMIAVAVRRKSLCSQLSTNSDQQPEAPETEYFSNEKWNTPTFKLHLQIVFFWFSFIYFIIIFFLSTITK